MNMKNKLMMILGLFAISMNAQATSLAPRVVMAKLTLNYYGKTYETVVNNYGYVQVKLGGDGIITTAQLKPETLALVDSYVRQVAYSKVKKTHSDMVCKMMTPPVVTESVSVSKVDKNSGLFTGKMRISLTDEGCYNTDHTFPADDYALAAVRTLRALLEMITYENTVLKRQ